jgi:hypothetical protein
MGKYHEKIAHRERNTNGFPTQGIKTTFNLSDWEITKSR